MATLDAFQKLVLNNFHNTVISFSKEHSQDYKFQTRVHQGSVENFIQINTTVLAQLSISCKLLEAKLLCVRLSKQKLNVAIYVKKDWKQNWQDYPGIQFVLEKLFACI